LSLAFWVLAEYQAKPQTSNCSYQNAKRKTQNLSYTRRHARALGLPDLAQAAGQSHVCNEINAPLVQNRPAFHAIGLLESVLIASSGRYSGTIRTLQATWNGPYGLLDWLVWRSP
jgi:hypothetical protein